MGGHFAAKKSDHIETKIGGHFRRNLHFIDKPGYKFVPEGELEDQKIQMRTQNLLVGRNEESIQDLIESFKANGFLNLDQIQVKPIGEMYLVLEGNRRVATLKYLFEQFKNGFDVGRLTESDFKSIEVVEHQDEDPKQHLIAMGLHHISGKRRWSPVNQAQLTWDLIHKYGMTEDEICSSLGITKHNLRRSLRTLALIDRYKESDYGDQFESNKYSLFEEVIRRTEMKNWLQWDDNTMRPTNLKNEERFFSWISKDEEIHRDEDDSTSDEQFITREPIITKSHEIREISKYINDDKALEKMENSRSISEAFAFSDAIGGARLQNALENIKKEVDVTFSFIEYSTEIEFEKIVKLRDKLDKLLPLNHGTVTINEKRSFSSFTSITKEFERLTIRNYRKLKGLEIKHLNRINVFAGGNNTGKTSLLECFYLLTQLNDINALLELERFRGKFYNELHSKWIDRSFLEEIDIEGLFNSEVASILITNHETEETFDKTNYISTISIDAKVGGTSLQSHVNLFLNKESELYYQRAQNLCQAAFTSPYRSNMSLLKRAHAYAVKEKLLEEVISFIRLNLDPTIEKIEMINEGDTRFIVTSSSIPEAIDITKYGEGLQRVFEIGLLMVYCKDGVLCIDEIDSAIHRNLLIKFTEFVQRLADQFNVQVFLSTHSKECIDAFILNGYQNDSITAYALSEQAGKVTCKYIDGGRLEKLIESIDLDIR